MRALASAWRRGAGFESLRQMMRDYHHRHRATVAAMLAAALSPPPALLASSYAPGSPASIPLTTE